jgi:uncharacterized membrane protein
MVAAGGKLAVKDRPGAIAVLIAVFLIGCLAGATGSYYWLKKSKAPVRISPDFRDRPMKEGSMPRPEPPRFREILGLTPDQDVSFQKIIGEARKQMTESRKQLDSFHAQQDEKLREIISDMNGKLISVLNEEQRQKFLAWQKDFESKRRSPHRRDFPPPQ